MNFIRSEVKAGNKPTKFDSAVSFSDDRYLQPVLEDDAVLFSIDDLPTSDHAEEPPLPSVEPTSHSETPDLEQQLRTLKVEYEQYRNQVDSILEKRWSSDDSVAAGSSKQPGNQPSKQDRIDDGYFDSYSYNEIHELMLKDTVRTDAYRDFIYDNKDIFAGKVVLDIGCGTGILSMFCAKAGAQKVIAVDNSGIIEKARLNIQKNGLDTVITCLHGKIEEVILPVEKVDIIVSEWMGYCLLFEAMLDSVLWARDRYLRSGGLMVPSHCTLHIAPVTDSDYIAENVSFWHEVYGFDMTAMLDKIHDDVLVRQMKPANMIGKPARFMELPLHTISTADLIFSKQFQVETDGSDEDLDGWVIWFDTFFLLSPEEQLPSDATALSFSSSGQKGIAFSTGPYSKETHWKSGVMLIGDDRRDDGDRRLAPTIEGVVEYKKGNADARALEIDITWKAAKKVQHQTWFLK